MPLLPAGQRYGRFPACRADFSSAPLHVVGDAAGRVAGGRRRRRRTRWRRPVRGAPGPARRRHRVGSEPARRPPAGRRATSGESACLGHHGRGSGTVEQTRRIRTTGDNALCANESEMFPGRWAQLADLLREAHESLARAGAAGARGDDVVALSRATRHAVRDATADVEGAVAAVQRVVLDARNLAAPRAREGPDGGCEPLRHKPSPGVDIGLDRPSVIPSYAMSSTGSTMCTGGHQ